MSRWPGYLPGVQDYEMRTRDEAKPHAPTRAELEDLFRDGADPVGDGTFRMVPSGDVVDLTEHNRRLSK